ncbi:hypothetical protein [Mycolicibacterium tokaiense]|uniref:Uncharacterized protein n=1 Tax=Mycolicibacterium tokaiense TaxID=39695 RepID=A0A378TDW4_9MYCO|nr:hypothetical protein [Mycolicibacterium tokaiense]BBY86504.1 hypothetical protein MTOK_22860 [Mycolicibacterium tokaiense]STZ58991.1 Uncharacterised protein [Mycolicibacterium tokaiense]
MLHDPANDDRLDLAAIGLRAALAATRGDHGALADALDTAEDCPGCLWQIAERLALNLAGALRHFEGGEAAEVRIEGALLAVLDRSAREPDQP